METCSLTRAAGAAQRVFSLMDSVPDIDINRGIVVDDRTFRGEMTIQGVEFTYQMRPDNQVRFKSLSDGSFVAGERRKKKVSLVHA